MVAVHATAAVHDILDGMAQIWDIRVQGLNADGEALNPNGILITRYRRPLEQVTGDKKSQGAEFWKSVSETISNSLIIEVAASEVVLESVNATFSLFLIAYARWDGELVQYRARVYGDGMYHYYHRSWDFAFPGDTVLLCPSVTMQQRGQDEDSTELLVVYSRYIVREML